MADNKMETEIPEDAISNIPMTTPFSESTM